MESAVQLGHKRATEAKHGNNYGLSERAEPGLALPVKTDFYAQLPRYWVLTPVSEPLPSPEPMPVRLDPAIVLRQGFLMVALVSTIISLLAAVFLFTGLH